MWREYGASGNEKGIQVEKSTIDLWVGVLVAIGLAAIMGLALKVGNLTTGQLGDTYRVTAAFENIGSLKPSAPVKSAGVLVGRVHSIAFDSQRFEAVVTLDLDQRYPFPSDTFANIYTAGLLGEQYIGLEAGGEETNLKNGDTIEKTQDAIVIENLISKFLFDKASETPTSATESTENDELAF